ncbi:MAG: low molecular weight protein arginine phosphatase [Verrucomicrobiales bacterium]|nr:low molecular weight protein arginine phosphatase [Verrucomicrobiales bacterium]
MNSRILFVCTGNVCRSPMAEGLFRDLAEKSGHEIEVASAGLGAMDGHGPSQNSVIAMKELGIDISAQRSQMFTPEMVDDFTHIFGMGDGHIETIRAYFPHSLEKTFVLREFIAKDEYDLNVPDPIGGDLEEYQLTRDLIEESMSSILSFVTTGDPAPGSRD